MSKLVNVTRDSPNSQAAVQDPAAVEWISPRPQEHREPLRARPKSAATHATTPSPGLRHFLDRMDLDRLLLTYVPGKKLGREPKLPHGRALLVMVANVLLSREPLYAVREWLDSHASEYLGLQA